MKLKVGIIGLGGVSDAHLESYKNIDDIEIVAAAEINQERLNLVKSRWGFRGYTDYISMLETEKLDLVDVCVPAQNHREVVEECARHKVHILCEKPLAVTTVDAKAMIDICNSNEVKLCYGAAYRWLTAARKAKELIDQGKLGPIRLLMEIAVGGKGLKNFRDAGAHHFPVGGPGGGRMGLIDHGIHTIDLFLWYMGSKIVSVFGRGNISGAKPWPEYITLFFENGAIGQLIYDEATFASDLPSEGQYSFGGGWDINGDLSLEGSWDQNPGSFRIHGDKGALRVFFYAQKVCYFAENKMIPIPVDHSPMPGNFELQMRSFANAVRNNQEPEVTGIDGYNAMCVIEAIYKSQTTGKITEVDYSI
jgi:predicted dehydrogenase